MIATSRIAVLFVLLFALPLAGQQGAPAVARAAPVAAQAAEPEPSPFFQPGAYDFNGHEGFVSLFDGKTLKGWEGDPAIWLVEDGTMVGEPAPGHPVDNTYLSYPGLKTRDFTLKLEIKVEKGGSGIQYRSRVAGPWLRPMEHKPSKAEWLIAGPQADIWPADGSFAEQFTGQYYVENSCGWKPVTTAPGAADCPLAILAWRGQVVASSATERPEVVATIGDRAALGTKVLKDGWNQYTVIARGGVLMQVLNGQLMSIYIDDNPRSESNQAGVFAIELEANGRVLVRSVWVKTVDR